MGTFRNINDIKWFISKFPESLYPCAVDNLLDYNNRVVNGHNTMSNSNVVICGLARDIASILPYTIARIEHLGSMFKSYDVIVYENDSTDGTDKILKVWSQDHRVHLISEQLKRVKHAQDTSYARTYDMAYYRNRYLDAFKELRTRKRVDYLIVLDMDLEGGFSYEGIAHSFSFDHWDVMTSNGLVYQNRTRLFYDAWAFRHVDHPEPHSHTDINILSVNRGDNLIRILSGFGGLAIYRNEAIPKWIDYKAGDCDHVTLHKQMISEGVNGIYLNPSQITVYSKTNYVL